MKLIVGLGNIGDRYVQTRHNVGFRALDFFVHRFLNEGVWQEKNKLEAMILQQEYLGEKIILLKPMTMMNLSGRSVQKAQNYFDVDINNVLVVHDDLDLSLGVLRFKKGGGSGGHHGIDSLLENLSSDLFTRLRLGVGKMNNNESMNKEEGSGYVLGKFLNEEKVIVDSMLTKSGDAIDCFLNSDLQSCMNLFNG